MKKLLVLVILCALGWQLHLKVRRESPLPLAAAASVAPPATVAELVTPPATVAELVAENRQTFTCDGRKYCAQMTSCEEATYFLKNCPGTKMDGDHDGIPCESQWCR
jgi:hypothetical protein